MLHTGLVNAALSPADLMLNSEAILKRSAQLVACYDFLLNLLLPCLGSALQ